MRRRLSLIVAFVAIALAWDWWPMTPPVPLSSLAQVRAQVPVVKVSPGAALLNAVTATGASAAFNVAQSSMVSFGISGTFVGTVTFQYSMDNSNWSSFTVYPQGSATGATTATTTGTWRGNVQGIPFVRANVTAYTSGSITVVALAENTVLPVVTP